MFLWNLELDLWTMIINIAWIFFKLCEFKYIRLSNYSTQHFFISINDCNNLFVIYDYLDTISILEWYTFMWRYLEFFTQMVTIVGVSNVLIILCCFSKSKTVDWNSQHIFKTEWKERRCRLILFRYSSADNIPWP